MSPMVGSRLKCERCREERPPHSFGSERIRLKNGPNGERLCSKHYHKAWEEYDD
jgi:hypothetical protein